MNEISNASNMNLKSQYPNLKKNLPPNLTTTCNILPFSRFVILNIGYWDLFGICFLGFVISLIMNVFSPGLAIAEKTRAGKPNIIYILADDAGYGDFGCYGQKEIKTPFIDTMAEDGIVFTNHYAGAPVCAPSRCSLLTGLHTGHSYIRGNQELIPEGQLHLSPQIKTLADVMKNAGLKTGVIGKWGLGGPGSTGEPNKKGFDYWFGYLCQRQAHNYYPDYLWKNGKKVALDGKDYTHDMFTDAAFEFIKKNKANPFFLYLPYTIPHAKLQVPDLEPYADKGWPDNKKRYAAMITRMDRDIGRILDLLKKLEIDNHTLMIFSSDNGPHAEGGANPDFFNSSGPLRGKKRDLYEGGIRVPMIARWPGKITPGSSSDHVSAFWDILPTFAELAGAPIPGNIDGISMVPTLLGDSEKQKRHTYLYWEFHEQGGKQAVRMGQWKAVKLGVRLDPDSPIALFNLQNDIRESHNVAGDHPEIVAEIEKIMKEGRSVSKEFPLLGKLNYGFSLFNGWLFTLPFAMVSFIFMLLGSVFGKMELPNMLIKSKIKEKVLYILSFIVTLSMFGLSVFLPLWFGTLRETYGIIFSVTGLLGYTATQVYSLFKNQRTLLSSNRFAIYYDPKTLFTAIFWIGVVIVTASNILLLLLFVFLILRYLELQFGNNKAQTRA